MKRALFAALLCTVSASVIAADLADTLKNQGQFTKLLAALDAAGLLPMLRRSGPYTIFAPTDEAFQALPRDRLEALMKAQNRAGLNNLLGYHIVVGRLGANEWREKKVSVKSSIGMPLTIEGERGRVTVNEARASRPEIAADNGVIHAIDRVMQPPTPIAPKT